MIDTDSDINDSMNPKNSATITAAFHKRKNLTNCRELKQRADCMNEVKTAWTGFYLYLGREVIVKQILRQDFSVESVKLGKIWIPVQVGIIKTQTQAQLNLT